MALDSRSDQRALRNLRAVAVIEVVKGVLVLVAAGLILGLLRGDVQATAEALVRHLHMNPGRHYPHVFAAMLGNFVDTHTIVLSIATVCYASVRFIEAYGLWHARAWAWGFGILSGALYIPFELVELSKRVSWAGGTVLLANVAIVILLWYSRNKTK